MGLVDPQGIFVNGGASEANMPATETRSPFPAARLDRGDRGLVVAVARIDRMPQAPAMTVSVSSSEFKPRDIRSQQRDKQRCNAEWKRLCGRPHLPKAYCKEWCHEDTNDRTCRCKKKALLWFVRR
jgi:hypothetical protein